MAKRSKVNMPQSTAGLIRYYDQDVKNAIKFKPEHILVVVSIVIIFELAIKFMF